MHPSTIIFVTAPSLLKSWWGPARGGTHAKRAPHRHGKDMHGAGQSKTADAVEKLRHAPALIAQSLPIGDLPFKDALAVGKLYYAELMRRPTLSPAFGNKAVTFNPKGWLYITNEAFARSQPSGDKKKRSEEEIRLRVSLLPKALAIIETVKEVDSKVDEGDGIKRYGLIGRFADGDAVRVIVEEVKDGGHTFLSVFDLDRVAKQLGRPSLPGRPISDAPSVQGKATDAPSGDFTIPTPLKKSSAVLVLIRSTRMNKFDLLKSHIDAYTRKDGSVVRAHETKHQKHGRASADAFIASMKKHHKKDPEAVAGAIRDEHESLSSFSASDPGFFHDDGKFEESANAYWDRLNSHHKELTGQNIPGHRE